MNWEYIILRFVHIVSGVFWAGTSILMTTVISPTVAGAGQEGGKFMLRMLKKSRYMMFISWASALTSISGLLLYWKTSGELNKDWLASGVGIGFTVGGLAGLAALAHGLLILSPTSKQVMALADGMESQGGPPSPEQGAEMGRLQKRLAVFGKVITILLIISVIGMATARYLWF